MKIGHFIFCAAVSAGSLAACGPTETPAQRDARLQALSAGVIAGAAADKIVVSDVDAGGAKVAWKARFNGADYNCDADEMYRLPACHQVGASLTEANR